MNDGDTPLRQELDARSSIERSLTLLKSRVTKAIHAGSTSAKHPSARTKKAKAPRKVLGSGCEKKLTEGPSSDNGIFDDDMVQAEVLWVSVLNENRYIVVAISILHSTVVLLQ